MGCMNSDAEQLDLGPEHRWRRGLYRFAQHLVRVDALRAVAVAALAFGIILLAGGDSSLGKGSLVVIGTLVTYILLPEEPRRFWRVRARDLASTVPPSDLQNAGLETTKALALQSGGIIGAESAALLWDDAVRNISRALGDPRRVVLGMDYRIAVKRDQGRQLVRSTGGGKRCWPGSDRVFFSFCSDVDALTSEYAAAPEGSIAREIVEPEPGEDLHAWERRVSRYPVTLVIDGKKLEATDHENRRLSVGSLSHRVVFDISGTKILEEFTPIQIISEFHQSITDRRFIVKFSNYFCVGSTQLTFEVDDPLALIEVNDFILDASGGLEFYRQPGLAGCLATLQTRDNTVLRPGAGVVFAWRPGELLAEVPEALQIDNLPEGAPLPSKFSLPKELLDTEAVHEPLSPVAGVRCIDAYHRLGISNQPRVLLARDEVVRRLRDAQSNLPDSFDFVVLDGWRSTSFQHRLIAYYESLNGGSIDGFVADPGSVTMRPPHVVGGALDLTLAFKGVPLALGSKYDDFSPVAHLHAFEAEDSVVRRLRRLMAQVLIDNGFAPYALEWWHWSYGDDAWAAFTGRQPLYDLIGDEHDAP